MHTHILPTLSDSPDGAVKSASDFKTLVTLLIKPIIWIIQLKQISYISFLFRSGKHINICLTGLSDPSIALCALMSLHGVTVNSARNRNKHPSASTMLTPIILSQLMNWAICRTSVLLQITNPQTLSFSSQNSTFSSWKLCIFTPTPK